MITKRLAHHKEGFLHHVLLRLLNSSKTNIGRISKVLLDKSNCFEKITHKQTSSLTCFDVENFYLSISSNLFKESVEFAKQFIQISDDEINSILFEGTTPWIKKSGNEDFDVPMGCFDGAEICELVWSYIQSKLTNITNKEDIELYRDDGLGIFQNISRPEIERKKKAIVKKFLKMWIINCS